MGTGRSLSDIRMPFPDCPKSLILGMNRVPVARLGPILRQDGATLTKKPFKHLPAPFPPAWDQQITKNIEDRRIGEHKLIIIYGTPDRPLWAAAMLSVSCARCQHFEGPTLLIALLASVLSFARIYHHKGCISIYGCYPLWAATNFLTCFGSPLHAKFKVQVCGA